MTEQQIVLVNKLYPVIERACKIGFDKLSLSFFYNLTKLCEQYDFNKIDELNNFILGYIEHTKEPKLETFLILFQEV